MIRLLCIAAFDLIVAVSLAVGLTLIPAAFPAWGTASAADADRSTVLGTIHVAAGEHSGDATTVNGSVEIGENAIVKRVETVNGGITLHAQAAAASLETVNGSAHVEQGARVAGSVHLVNGKITLDREADVGGRLTNVNGSIELTGAHAGGGIETTTGDISVGANSRVEGGILVDNQTGISLMHRVPRIVIGPGTVVKGKLTFMREVKLYVSDKATIGPVEGATPNRFSGEKAPE